MRGEADFSTTYSKMSESAGKLRKRYTDHPRYRYKLIFLVRGLGNSSDECKVLGDFGSKYSKSRTTKDRRQKPEKMKKFNRKKDNNAIVQHAVDEIILHENMK